MDETFRNLVVVVITIITGIIGVPIIQFLKTQFGWTDRPALLLSLAIAVILGVIELLLGKQLDLGNLTFENLPAMFTLIYTTATVYYQFFKGTTGVLGNKLMVPYSAKDTDYRSAVG